MPSTEKFNEYVLGNITYVARVARSLSRSDSEGEDLAQETLLKAFKGIDNFDGRHPKAWLARIARNTAINRDTRTRESTVAADDLAQIGSQLLEPADSPERFVVDESMDPILRTALDELPPEFRAVVNLVDVEQFRYQEAAEILQVPVGTVMSRLHRARRRLRKALVEEGLRA